MDPVEEEIITDPETGARKAQKLARFDLIPAFPLWQLAEHYGKGCKKYSDRNWEKGYDWSLSYDALQRHLNLFWQGEDIDSETGSLHIIAVAWHAFALAEFFSTHPEKDNRPANTRPVLQHEEDIEEVRQRVKDYYSSNDSSKVSVVNALHKA